MFEILYGRDFSKQELASQPIKEIVAQSLVLDDEIEKEHIRQSDMKSKTDSGGFIVGTKDVHDKLFEWKYPEDANAVVTLLTTEEYLEIAESTNNY